MKRADYFLDFQKLEAVTNTNYCFDERDKASFKIEFLKQMYLNKPAIKYKYPVMLYLGNKKFSMKYELEDILEMIKNGATKAETEYYRKYFTEIITNKQKQQFLNSLKSFTPCGIFYNRNSRVEIRQLNGIVMLQNIYVEINEQQIQLIKDDKLTFAVFSLLDINRFVVLVKTTGMNSKNYKEFQKYVKTYYHNLLRENILHETQINTTVYVPCDENIYFDIHSNILSTKSNKIMH